jgi:hypothetical protein
VRATSPARPWHPADRRAGLLQGDTIQRVIGPVSHSIQWLVGWRSGAISTLTKSQLKAKAPLVLMDWYESTMDQCWHATRQSPDPVLL